MRTHAGGHLAAADPATQVGARANACGDQHTEAQAADAAGQDLGEVQAGQATSVLLYLEAPREVLGVVSQSGGVGVALDVKEGSPLCGVCGVGVALVVKRGALFWLWMLEREALQCPCGEERLDGPVA